MGKVVDKNDFWFIQKNPITKVGVFPYLGKQISQDCEPNKIYYVLRPKEELFKKETLDSLKLLPLVDEHTMLGKDFTPAEEKGIDGVLGEQVVHDSDTIYTDIKIYSEEMKDLIRNGKKELSLGYLCSYDKAEGTYKGQRYDYIQRNIIGNHLALVDKGRMGSDVRVYDSKDGGVFAMDSIEITMDDDKDVKEWITVRGTHIPIMKGENKADAVKKFINGKGGSNSNRSNKNEGSSKSSNKGVSVLKNAYKDGGYDCVGNACVMKGNSNISFRDEDLKQINIEKYDDDGDVVEQIDIDTTDEKKLKKYGITKDIVKDLKKAVFNNKPELNKDIQVLKNAYNDGGFDCVGNACIISGDYNISFRDESLKEINIEEYDDDGEVVSQTDIKANEVDKLKEYGVTEKAVTELRKQVEKKLGKNIGKDMDIESRKYKQNKGEDKMTELEKFLTGKISQDEMEEVKKIVEKEKEDDEDEDDKKDDDKKEGKDKKSAKDKCGKDEDKDKNKKDDCEDEDDENEDDDKKKEGEDEDEDKDDDKKKKDDKAMDEATFIKVFARKEKLGKEVEKVLGTFDHSEMTELEIAKYACDKLELGAEEGQEISTLKGYLKGVEKQKVEVKMKTEDSFNVVEDKSFDNYLKNAKK